MYRALVANFVAGCTRFFPLSWSCNLFGLSSSSCFVGLWYLGQRDAAGDQGRISGVWEELGEERWSWLVFGGGV